MPPTRKRRAPANEASDASDADERQTQRRRVSAASDDDDVTAGDVTAPQGDSNFDQMVKNLVRLALACEYSRTPIRRADITTKVLTSQSRQFKAVFAEAQTQLRATFGMEMTELPLREKVTLAQRRAAQKSQNTQKSSNAWILTSVLPERFRQPEILPPPQAPTTELESQYTGLYTFVVSLIFLSGGTLPDGRLERYLSRTNVEELAAQNSMSVMNSGGTDKTEKLLKRMEKDGYIVKVRDNSSGEETVDWVVGPRGKAEVGDQGVRGLVRSVYGDSGDVADVERRLERSLGVLERRTQQQEQSTQTQKKRGRRKRNEAMDEGGESDESSEDE